MAKREIFIEQIAGTVVRRDAVRRWLDVLGVSESYELPDIPDASLLVALAGKRCYNSFEVGLNPNVTKIRTEWCEYIDNVLASGHGSVLEHAVGTFVFEGVSRVFTAELNRHRAGCAMSEASMRYIRFEESIDYWEPVSIRGPDVLSDAEDRFVSEEHPKVIEKFYQQQQDLVEDELKQASRIIFERAFAHQEEMYKVLCAIWSKKLAPDSKFAGKKAITSMMRRIVGLGCATGEVWTGNMRALRHVLTMRADPSAEEEIAWVFTRVARMLIGENPMLFGDFEEDANGFFRPKYRKV